MASTNHNATFTGPVEYHTFPAILFDMGEPEPFATAMSVSLILVQMVRLLIAQMQ